MNQYEDFDRPLELGLTCEHTYQYWVCCLPAHPEAPDRHYMIEWSHARFHAC